MKTTALWIATVWTVVPLDLLLVYNSLNSYAAFFFNFKQLCPDKNAEYLSGQLSESAKRKI